MASMVDEIRKIVQSEIKKIHTMDLGVVTSIFPHSSENDKDNYECNVKLKNKDLEPRKVPVSTQQIGLTFIPNVGDLVLVTYVNGDVNQPIVIGKLYNDEDRPPLNNDKEVIYIPPNSDNPGKIDIKFPGGVNAKIDKNGVEVYAGKSKIILSGNGKVHIESTGGEDESISIYAKDLIDIKGEGGVFISPDDNADSHVIIQRSGHLQITSKNESVIITADNKGISISAEKDAITLKGKKIILEATESLEIKSKATAKIEAAATMGIKGAKVNIN